MLKINEATTNDRNGAEMAGFLLMGFSGSWKFQTAHASLFLLVDVAASTGSILITILDVHLQTPMYFFLSNCFDGLNFCYFPNPLSTHANPLSFLGCARQAFFITSVASTETATLTMLSYDCYVVTYWPLYCEVIMNQGTCVRMMAVSAEALGPPGDEEIRAVVFTTSMVIIVLVAIALSCVCIFSTTMWVSAKM
ncbi:hypothetical protein U0070_013036, partial [Myodes glareolus]